MSMFDHYHRLMTDLRHTGPRHIVNRIQAIAWIRLLELLFENIFKGKESEILCLNDVFTQTVDPYIGIVGCE